MGKQIKGNHLPNESERPFESDAHKLSSLHMADQHHVISDEEMQNLRVGVNPSQKEANTDEVNEGRRAG